jgi:hypothetical protein
MCRTSFLIACSSPRWDGSPRQGDRPGPPKSSALRRTPGAVGQTGEQAGELLPVGAWRRRVRGQVDAGLYEEAILIFTSHLHVSSSRLIFTPIFLPIVIDLGVSPIHFGAMMVFNMCLGNISPPVGNNLFVAARVAGVKVEPVIGRLMPMFYALTASLFIVTFVPEPSMWLPEQLGLITGP